MDGHSVQRARSSPALPLPRRFDESWYEVSSQPSSSSLSSVGDEIVTTGLHVGSPYNRRRRLHPSARAAAGHRQHTAVQYDETESEEDRFLTSSGEKARRTGHDDSDADSDGGDDDNATALGRVSDRPGFQPQPNAFSHPHVTRRTHSNSGAVAPHPFSRPSFSQRSQTRVHRNFMSPSSAREDNDAALRASLTTLLSCAAAARGLPKTREEAEQQRLAGNGVEPSDQPMGLKLVPESELTSAQPDRSAPKVSEPSRSRAGEKPKRAVSTGRSPRAKRKRMVAEDALISPTLLTWVMSAGVVVLVSVVGFGAGYVMGREVGRQEALSASASSVNETTRCGREMMGSGGGLRRLRWGAVGRRLVAQA
ncbi:hypothetical protein L249_3482 [Ophiocordyceps polyrhachis-furcata BCC 54312]|uniref:Uncharacterized protein n=1 Tax=Ophiocordyceps polyrhachis-furcata BCC 54312 TaxID=1330021 RepID=A0A367LMT6_9HYPO|nr:hypothetical protein L249_3482 [Ophiocordyceps polyrhachis-furcata BCC 54312]